MKNRTIISATAKSEQEEKGDNHTPKGFIVAITTFSIETVKRTCKSTNNKRITKQLIDKIHEMKQIMRRKDQYKRKIALSLAGELR